MIHFTERLSVCAAFVALALPTDAQSFCDGGSALRFDGSNDRVTIPYDASFPGAIFTAAAWIRADLPIGPFRESILARGEDDFSFDGPWFLMMGTTGTLQVQIENSDGPGQNAFYDSGIVVDDGTWHHVAASRTASGTLSLYVDGEPVAVFTNTIVPSPDNAQVITIGCTHGMLGPVPPGETEPPIQFFEGLIDDAEMWNVALNEEQVAQLASDGVVPTSTGLVGYWPLDEGTSQFVQDLSSAGDHGVLGDLLSTENIDPV